MNATQRKHRPIVMPIDAKQTEENLRSGKHILYRRQRVLENHITGDTYENSLIFDARLLKNKVINIRNDDASNAAHVKILGCIDPSDWRELLTETSIAASTKLPEQTSAMPYAYLKVQAKSATSGNPAKVTAFIAGMTP